MLILSEDYPRDGLLGHHPKSSCCKHIAGKPLENYCLTFGSRATPIHPWSNCTCVDFLYCRLVVVTAFSSNHFKEAQDMIASTQHSLPNTRIIVYDLGLSEDEKLAVNSFCNVELRLYNSSIYPAHADELFTYAWKPIITAEVSREYEVILYGDASVRIFEFFPVRLLPHLLHFPYVAGKRHRYPLISVTHDSTIKYLRLNISREEAAKAMPFSNIAIYCVWLTEMLREKWLNRWFDCALHRECIAPQGSHPHGCRGKTPYFNETGEFIGCHRFDMSALNIIIYQEFGQHIWQNISHDRINMGKAQAWSVHREVTQYFSVKASNCKQTS